MDKKLKNRLIPVIGAVIIVGVIVAFVVGGNSMARTVLVSEAPQFSDGQKIMVSGDVVRNSFVLEDGVLTFELFDSENDPSGTTVLPVRYEGAVPEAFGNEIRIICGGSLDKEGVLVSNEILAKCPPKYEKIAEALTIAELLDYGNRVIGKPVKVAGTIKDGTLDSSDATETRFVLADAAAGDDASGQLKVRCTVALPDKAAEGSNVILLGLLCDDGDFLATQAKLAE